MTSSFAEALARTRARLAEALARRRVALGFACAAIALWLAKPTPRSLVIGATVASVGELLRIWAAGHLEKGREVTVSGPYRFSRHPLYVGSSLIGVGIAIASASLVVARAHSALPGGDTRGCDCDRREASDRKVRAGLSGISRRTRTRCVTSLHRRPRDAQSRVPRRLRSRRGASAAGVEAPLIEFPRCVMRLGTRDVQVPFFRAGT